VIASIYNSVLNEENSLDMLS